MHEIGPSFLLGPISMGQLTLGGRTNIVVALKSFAIWVTSSWYWLRTRLKKQEHPGYNQKGGIRHSLGSSHGGDYLLGPSNMCTP